MNIQSECTLLSAMMHLAREYICEQVWCYIDVESVYLYIPDQETVN